MNTTLFLNDHVFPLIFVVNGNVMFHIIIKFKYTSLLPLAERQNVIWKIYGKDFLIWV